MQVSRDDLTQTFRELSDEDLLARVRAGNLTELAREVATSELRSRGLELASQSSVATELGTAHESGDITGEPDPTDGFATISAAERFEALAAVLDEGDLELVTVHRLTNPLTANVLRSCLEAHGVYVHLWGEHLGTAHIVFSHATGGMRIQVPRGQAAQAQEIIAAWESCEISMEDVPPIGGEPPMDDAPD